MEWFSDQYKKSGGLESYNDSLDAEKEKEIAMIIQWSEVAEETAADEIVKNLNATQLVDLINKSFKVQDTNVWQQYWEMKKNKFYFFTVEAAIDLLSDKLVKEVNGQKVEQKFNEEWIPDDSENWHTLDWYLNREWWIDNKYSRNLVKLVQKILWIKKEQCDGLAGPQFFAKISSVLSWNPISEFKVQWYDDQNRYKYGLDDDIANYNQQVEADNNRKDQIVKSGNLVEVSEDFNRSYFWIPEGAKVYMKNNYNGYYYFNNNKIVFVPNLSSWNYPICLQEADISHTVNFPSDPQSWEKSYPSNCGVFRDKLNSILSNSLSSLWISSDKYSLDFENASWKYVLKSYWNSIQIHLDTITSWWIYSNDLWSNLQLLNLCNYLKSKNLRGTFSFNRNWKKILLDGKEMNDVFAFDGNKYKKVDSNQQNKFVNYLNTYLYV